MRPLLHKLQYGFRPCNPSRIAYLHFDSQLNRVSSFVYETCSRKVTESPSLPTQSQNTCLFPIPKSVEELNTCLETFSSTMVPPAEIIPYLDRVALSNIHFNVKSVTLSCKIIRAHPHLVSHYDRIFDNMVLMRHFEVTQILQMYTSLREHTRAQNLIDKVADSPISIDPSFAMAACLHYSMCGKFEDMINSYKRIPDATRISPIETGLLIQSLKGTRGLPFIRSLIIDILARKIKFNAHLGFQIVGIMYENKDYKLTNQVIDLIKALDEPLSDIELTYILRISCEMKNLVNVVFIHDIFRDRDKGIPGHATILLADYYSSNGHEKFLDALLADQYRHNGLRLSKVLNSLMLGYSRIGKLDVSNSLFANLEEFGCEINLTTFITRAKILGHHRLFDQLRELENFLYSQSLFPLDSSWFSQIIRAYGYHPHPAVASEILQETLSAMKTRNIPPTSDTLFSLLQTYQQLGLEAEQASLVDKFKAISLTMKPIEIRRFNQYLTAIGRQKDHLRLQQ